MSHYGFRFDDYHMWASFWSSLNGGWNDMNYKWEFEKFWGKNAKPETIVLSPEDFDALVEAINKPPEYNEKIARVLSRKAPWNNEE